MNARQEDPLVEATRAHHYAEGGYTMQNLTEEDAIGLAAGWTSKAVQAMAMMLIETDDARCLRNAAKPLARKKGKAK